MRYELVFRRNVKHRNASGYQEIIIPKLKKDQNLKDGPDGYKKESAVQPTCLKGTPKIPISRKRGTRGRLPRCECNELYGAARVSPRCRL